MNNKTIYLICGLSGSGKLAYTTKLHLDMPNSLVLDPCAIRSTITCDRSEDSLKANFPVAEAIIQEICQMTMKTMLDSEYCVLYVAENLTKKDRARVIKNVPKEYKIFGVWMNTPVVECQKAKFNDPGNYLANRWFSIIDGQNARREELELSEGFEKIYTI